MEQRRFAPTPFALAPQAFRAFLPKRVKLSDEDAAKIYIPDRRYGQIKDGILELFRRADVKFIPLDPLAIAQALGCGPVPYRTLGRLAMPALIEASHDALTCWMLGSDSPLILFNDRQNPARVAFSVAHELGHVMLGHHEHSKLAEKEANYFAANALCPLPMLEATGLSKSAEVAKTFAISEECAINRLAAMRKWRDLPYSRRNVTFEAEIVKMLKFKRPIQLTLLGEEAS